MRKINDMLKLIPPDELNGGITMNRTNRTDGIKSNNSYSKAENVKLRRGTSGLIAAALVLAVGGGALAVALTRSKDVTPSASGAQSITASSGQTEADAAAENIYKLIDANIAARIEDGHLSEIKPGAFTADMASPDDFTAAMLARTLDPKKYVYADTVNHFTASTADIGELPAGGQVFYRINTNYKLDFVQYRAYEGAAVGQFSSVTDGRTEFGKLPETADSTGAKTSSAAESCEHAKAFYRIFNRMQNDYFNGEYPVNQNWAMLPPGQLLVLDLDNRSQYADTIWRMEQYNTENIEFTGKLFIEYTSGNDPYFVAWQPAEGGVMETVSEFYGDGLWNGGDISDKDAAFALNDVLGGYDLLNSSVASTMGCGRYFLQRNGYVHGVITERSNMPEVFEWYNDFLEKNYAAVDFDPDKLISPDKLEKVIKFHWIDFERKEPVIIRTSDMKGANIYVNGRYYNVEDTSVLELLENGMPPAVKADFDDGVKTEETN